MNKATRAITYETKDYNQFKKLIGNRQIDAKNVGAIAKNIQKNGLLPTVVICNEKMEVIDGQHRIEALKRLNLPVYYQIHRGLGLKDCIAFNISSKKWTSQDYINTYVSQGNKDYIQLQRFAEKYSKLSIVRIACVCIEKGTQGSTVLNQLAEGTFKIKNVSEANERLSYINEVYDFIKCNGKKPYVIPILGNLFDLEIVDMDRMKEQIKKNNIRDFSIASQNDCLDFLSEVYNYHKKQKVRFKDEYLNRFGGK